MLRTNKTRYTEWHETCKCKCWLDESVCNCKQTWNNNKCRCEWKELIDRGICDKGFIWNTSNCECECDKPSDVEEYLDYENCKCWKKLVDKLVEECNENIDEKELPSKEIYPNEQLVMYVTLVNAFPAQYILFVFLCSRQ